MKESMTTIFPDVLIIGVGGGGCNIINDLKMSFTKAVIDSVEQPDIDTLLNEEIKTVFIVTCLGGEYGTAVAPLIAAECRKRKLNTIGVATLPFEFEGVVKRQRANNAANELARNCDSVNLIHNEIMLKGDQTIAVNEAFKDVNIRISEIITKELYSIPIWFFGKSEGFVIKDWFKKCFGWLRKNDGALVCKSFKENDYKITPLCIEIVEQKAKKVMEKRWFRNLGEHIKFNALLNTLMYELYEEGGGSIFHLHDIVYDVLIISRIWPVESWAFIDEAIDYQKAIQLENSHIVVARIRKKRREVLRALNFHGMCSFA